MSPDDSPSLNFLQTLERWNRWGQAELAPRVRRRVVDDLETFLETPEILALIGPRRAGKTTVLFQLMDVLEDKGIAPEAMLHINLEEPALLPYLGTDLLEDLYNTFRRTICPEGRAWLFLDEVQRVPSWERWVRARNESEDVKIFVTGSSSALLSGELATLLTGRHVTFRVLPLDFAEFLQFRGVKLPEDPLIGNVSPEIEANLDEYLFWGGFPEVALASSESRRRALLSQYFDDSLFKDVALRHQVRDLDTLRSLAVYLLSQTASRISMQRIANIFGVSTELARSYCRYLEEAFLVSFLPFYTLKTAERMRRPRKVHAVDLGLRNIVSLTGAPDRGRLAETAVHNTLAGQSPGQTTHDGLFYWEDEVEIDLILRRSISVHGVIQVTDSLTHPGARARELRSLSRARLAFPQAQSLLVARHIPTDDVLDKEIPTTKLWRFLLSPRTAMPLLSGERSSEMSSLLSDEEKVLRHLSKNRRITRQVAARVCSLSGVRASSLLRRMVNEGSLKRHGRGRGTWYSLNRRV